MKPRIIVTRRWPAVVERILADRFDTTLNAGDIPLTPMQLKAAFLNFDAILPTVSDELPASVFPDGDLCTKLIANFGVGFSHIDLEASRQRGIIVTNTPGVLTDCTADIACCLPWPVAWAKASGSCGRANGRVGARPT